ncbi:hypothetical protein [Pseudoduganella umbonata]|uniref:Uncharacterized protein n=1 Tax=Pseudoduganella umbonata TaxID=864828 RepID=A0A4P8HRT7_9BURK|nr:hypothetical protein [Pseudoduganella umbonata]MBB3224281.1 hypothetical protein [Pseudoduganella umbonata]QCP11338.1 hypothetical protein FCL38_13640 [Pseudoduganella umbonata]
MRKIFVSMLSSMLVAGPALAAQPDLTNAAAFENTCTAAAARAPVTVQERQAYVICNDIALVQQTRTFIEQGLRRIDREMPSEAAVALAVRQQLTYMRAQLRKSRSMLEKIRITSASEGLLIAPSTWVRDLDGDGKIAISERYFFALPARNDGDLTVGMPSEDEDYYASEYNLNATIRLDQTDILWGLSYHYYAEALVEVLLSYQLDRNTNKPDQAIRLAHPENMRQAQALIVAGLKTSEKMRLSALAETDDDLEWLGNPRQASTVFPVPLDDADFNVWGELMGHLIPLFQGKTLLPAAQRMSGPLGSMGSLCPAGKGFSLQWFFQHPPKYPLEFFNRSDTALYCRKLDAARPASGLFDFIARYGEAMEGNGRAAMRFLRRLIWVN